MPKLCFADSGELWGAGLLPAVHWNKGHREQGRQVLSGSARSCILLWFAYWSSKMCGRRRLLVGVLSTMGAWKALLKKRKFHLLGWLMHSSEQELPSLCGWKMPTSEYASSNKSQSSELITKTAKWILKCMNTFPLLLTISNYCHRDKMQSQIAGEMSSLVWCPFWERLKASAISCAASYPEVAMITDLQPHIPQWWHKNPDSIQRYAGRWSWGLQAQLHKPSAPFWQLHGQKFSMHPGRVLPSWNFVGLIHKAPQGRFFVPWCLWSGG